MSRLYHLPESITQTAQTYPAGGSPDAPHSDDRPPLARPRRSAGSSAHAVFVGAYLDRAAAICPDADCCSLTGDLAGAGKTGAYRGLKHQIDALAFKSIPLLGNHDDRDAFRGVFGGDGFCQSVR